MNAGLVLWQKAGAYYDAPGWVSLAGVDWVEVTTDGEKMWTQVGQ